MATRQSLSSLSLHGQWPVVVVIVSAWSVASRCRHCLCMVSGQSLTSLSLHGQWPVVVVIVSAWSVAGSANCRNTFLLSVSLVLLTLLFLLGSCCLSRDRFGESSSPSRQMETVAGSAAALSDIHSYGLCYCRLSFTVVSPILTEHTL